MKKIAIITGASGGIGSQFVKQMRSYEIDEIWAIGRNQNKLKELQQQYGDNIVPMILDLSQAEAVTKIKERLQQQSVKVTCLINNAGVARMGKSVELERDEIGETIDVNCKVAVQLCNLCIPYMERGSFIINVSSASAFQPTPYINLYAATKVFLRHYSRGLSEELEGTGITVTAVCPGWVDTELLPGEVNGKKVGYPGIVSAEKVVSKALKDVAKGKDMSVCTLFVKYQHLVVKFMPQKWVMRIWKRFVGKYFK